MPDPLPQDAGAPTPPLAERRARNGALLARFIGRSAVMAFVLALVSLPPAMCLLGVVEVRLTDLVLVVTSLCLLAVMAVPAVWWSRHLWRQLGVRVLVFADRIVYVRREQSVSYTWHELERYYCWGVNRYSSVLGLDTRYMESQYHYRFCHRDGHRFEFSETFDREDKEPIAAYVEAGLLECQLPQLRKRFVDDQEAIAFGPFVLEPEGLRWRRRLLPWNEVDYCGAEEGKIRVRKRGKVFNWCSVEMEKVPNGCLLLALAKERVEQEEANPR
jgi:hypothetical protein